MHKKHSDRVSQGGTTMGSHIPKYAASAGWADSELALLATSYSQESTLPLWTVLTHKDDQEWIHTGMHTHTAQCGIIRCCPV